MKDHVRIPARLNGAVVSGIARDRPGDRCGTRTAAHLEFNELKLVRKYSGISNDGSKVHHLCIFLFTSPNITRRRARTVYVTPKTVVSQIKQVYLQVKGNRFRSIIYKENQVKLFNINSATLITTQILNAQTRARKVNSLRRNQCCAS